MRLEDLVGGQVVVGVVPGATVTVVAVSWAGTDSAVLTYKDSNGALAERVLYRSDETALSVGLANQRSFEAPAADFKLAAEAQRIRLAGIYDPMLAVSTSDVRPLPHQITAVYEELLPQVPLRFLLADDPGAGKTIMAGLFVKELLLRDDVRRCLIVAPGGLVEQWQDELFFKFGLSFELLTTQMIDATVHGSVFDTHPLLIGRMDQLSRNGDLRERLKASEWDLIVVDEAHRMGAHYFGNEQRFTQRFELGQILGEVTRHLLLMTATPHSGKEEDFQLFLTLLDKDRFAGKARAKADTTGIMRRMVKEQLLTFEGKPLFPERIAETVPYDLTDDELELYTAVTNYVRQGMNRAERLNAKRKNTVGFALTVLQRRVASSPEAIYQSLIRRADRLAKRRQDILNGVQADDTLDVDPADFDEDAFSADQTEQLEDSLLDQATSAQTVEELEAEIAELRGLIAMAAQVRASGTDRKWTELSRILQDEAITIDAQGRPRKLIVFTEHRDTLNYLQDRIGNTVFGQPEKVVAIHGGVSRAERRQITAEFTHNPEVQILLATDAAGEGLNLQVAHLMVNYDLPWNPNRIEQRFGRVHRIGQTEVCRLWNLVADNTREGEVFTALLGKLEQMRATYGGKVFDVLGESFTERPLRDLLLDAIKYGDDPQIRAQMQQVIDRTVGDGLKELLDERALASNPLAGTELDKVRRVMDEARARRLQPHYIQQAFTAAFTRLGGRMTRRETGRFEIRHVPATLRTDSDRAIASRYERICFDLSYIQPDGQIRAELIAPGHPLHDAVMDQILTRYAPALETGTMLVSNALDEPRLLVGMVEQISNAHDPQPIARRFSYAWVDQNGTVTDAGPAPYLDCVPAPADHPATQAARALNWVAGAEKAATTWIITERLPQYMAEAQPRIAEELTKTRHLVNLRLIQERDRLALDAVTAASKEAGGDKPKQSSEFLTRKAEELEARRQRRMAILDRQLALSPAPPRITTAALVLPATSFTGGHDLPDMYPRETKEVERRGVEATLAAERSLGRIPVEQPFNNPGFDILTTDPTTGTDLRIEVKARIKGATEFYITHTEVITAKNSAPRYRLALVAVDPDNPEEDDITYIDQPFATTDLGDLETAFIAPKWAPMIARGSHPH